MGSVKTAISIEKSLMDEVEALAEEMKVSRSLVFTLAARDFVRYHKNQRLLKAINAAVDEAPDAIEASLQSQMKSKHRRLVKDQW